MNSSLRGSVSFSAVFALLIVCMSSENVHAAITVTGTNNQAYPGTNPDPWAIGDALVIGDAATGSMTVDSGSDVSNTFGTLGDLNSSGDGTVVIDGAGSTWTNTASLAVGSEGTGMLTITNGGLVTNTAGFISQEQNSVGKVLVDGTNSTWSNSSTLTVGRVGFSNGTLNIKNGGTVSNLGGTIAGPPNSVGTVTVDGPGSTWTNSGNLTVGGSVSATGTLNINNGGMVVARSLGGAPTGNSSVNFDGGTLRITLTDQAQNLINVNAGSGTLDISANETFTLQINGISGVGGLTKKGGGTLKLTQPNTYQGSTLVSGGALTLSTSGSIASTSAVTIQSGATLNGNGTVSGPITVNADGTLAAGESVGTLFTADVSFTGATSNLAMELDFNAMTSDLVNVTGTVSFASSLLSLSLLNLPLTLTPTTFMLVQNDGIESVTGAFGTINIPPGYSANVEYAYAGVDAAGRPGDGNDVAVTISQVAAVPEAGTIAMFTLALLTAITTATIETRRRMRFLRAQFDAED